MRTPSERNRARSLDDLTRSGADRAAAPASQQHQQHQQQQQHQHQQQQQQQQQLGLGNSDNGLDKLGDWDAPFKPVAPPSHWHSLSGGPTALSSADVFLGAKNDVHQVDDRHRPEKRHPNGKRRKLFVGTGAGTMPIENAVKSRR